MNTRNLTFLFLMEFWAGFARGAYLVCIGWVTLIISGDVAKVGQVFIVAMMTIMLSGPIVGLVVDRYDRKKITIIAHLGLLTILGGLGFALKARPELSVGWIFVAVIGVTILRSLYQSAHDGLIHNFVAPEKLVHTVARFRGLHLMATAIGTVATGFVIERVSAAFGYGLAALASGFSVWLCRIIIDGKVLQSCATEHVGRTKTYVDIMFSFGAFAMCLSPSLIRLPSTSGYFLFWGVIVMLVSVLLGFVNYNSQRRNV